MFVPDEILLAISKKNMKRFITLFLVSLVLAGASYSQVKVKFKLVNPGVDSQGKFYYYLVAVIQPGQTWRVGSSNIRVAFRTVPVNGLTVLADNPVQSPLACINSGGYSPLTTTSLNGGVRISFNITRTGVCCTLSTGTYILGKIRFNRVDTTCCSIDTISTSGAGGSVIQDSITTLVWGTQWLDSNFLTCTMVSKEDQSLNIPKEFNLYQNYPNPFNPLTSIKFDIPKETKVKLLIFDILGREVTLLINEKLKPGTYDAQFDGTNYPSGVYFYKLETESFTKTRKMVLVK